MERQRGDGLVKPSSCANHLSGPASHQKDTIPAGASLAAVQMAIRSDPDSQTQPGRISVGVETTRKPGHTRSMVVQMQQQTAASPMRIWHLTNVAWKKMLEAPANLGSQLVAWPPVASRMEASYERAKRSHEAHLPRLRGADARIVEDLKKASVSITSLEAMGLEGVDALLADAYALVARHSPWTRSFQADGADIVAHEKIIRWGLSDRLLDIAENYLGVPVGYDGANVYFTKADGMETGQRRWHRDAEDSRMLKIALYLNDVDEDGGPLQVLRRQLPDHDRMVRGKFPIMSQEQLETALGDFDPDEMSSPVPGKPEQWSWQTLRPCI